MGKEAEGVCLRGPGAMLGSPGLWQLTSDPWRPGEVLQTTPGC